MKTSPRSPLPSSSFWRYRRQAWAHWTPIRKS
jgi:hypothetical protein